MINRLVISAVITVDCLPGKSPAFIRITASAVSSFVAQNANGGLLIAAGRIVKRQIGKYRSHFAATNLSQFIHEILAQN